MSKIRITDLNSGQCKFPVTPYEALTHFFCGEPVEREGCPYCPEHAALCFDRRSPARRRADEDRARRMRDAKLKDGEPVVPRAGIFR